MTKQLTSDIKNKIQVDIDYLEYTVSERYEILKNFKEEYINDKEVIITNIETQKKILLTYKKYLLKVEEKPFPIIFIEEIFNIIENDLNNISVVVPNTKDYLKNKYPSIKPLKNHFLSADIDAINQQMRVYSEAIEDLMEIIQDLHQKWQSIVDDFINSFCSNYNKALDFLDGTPELNKLETQLKLKLTRYYSLLQDINSAPSIIDHESLKKFIETAETQLIYFEDTLKKNLDAIKQDISNAIDLTNLNIINSLYKRMTGLNWKDKSQILTLDKLKEIRDLIKKLPEQIEEEGIKLLVNEHLWDAYNDVWKYICEDKKQADQIMKLIDINHLKELNNKNALDFEEIISYRLEL